MTSLQLLRPKCRLPPPATARLPRETPAAHTTRIPPRNARLPTPRILPLPHARPREPPPQHPSPNPFSPRAAPPQQQPPRPSPNPNPTMACMPAVSAPSVLAPAPASTRTHLCYSTEMRRGALSLRPARAIPTLRLGGHRDARGAVVVRATAAEVFVATGTYSAPRGQARCDRLPVFRCREPWSCRPR